MNTSTILKGYLEAALWADTEEPTNKIYTTEDIDSESIEKAKEDITKFIHLAGSLLNEIEDEQIGHDFYLTRNGHGAGFWDRNYKEMSTGEKLTKICKKFKTLYIEKYDGNLTFI